MKFKTTSSSVWKRIASATLSVSLLCTATALTGLSTQPLHAASITVDDTCTLADAITAANSDNATNACPAGDGADIIYLNDASLLLTTCPYEVDGLNGLPSVTSNVTIQNGTVAASALPPRCRIFHVDNGHLTLQNMHVLGGIANNPSYTLYSGGGIFMRNNASLTVVDSRIEASHARDGGAIYAIDANTIHIEQSAIVSNTAASMGGALFVKDTNAVVIRNSAIDGNRSSGNGGGIVVEDSDLQVDNSSVSHNMAFGDGGGLHSTGSGIEIITSNLQTNLASNGNGGAIFYQSSSNNVDNEVTISQSCLAQNDAQSGAAIYTASGANGHIINANNNWWGAVSGPAEEGVGTGDGINNGTAIDYIPFIITPTFDCRVVPSTPTPTSTPIPSATANPTATPSPMPTATQAPDSFARLPHLFWGQILLDDAPAADGTRIDALVDGVVVAITQTFTNDDEMGLFRLEIPANDIEEGTRIQFRVDNTMLRDSHQWQSGGFTQLYFGQTPSIATPTATPTPTLPAPAMIISPPTPTATPTMQPMPSPTPIMASSFGGRVVDSAGALLTGVTVELYAYNASNDISNSSWAFIRQTQTDSQGDYRFVNLPAGDYTLYFHDPFAQHIDEYYGDTDNINNALRIALQPFQQVDGIDAVLNIADVGQTEISGQASVFEQPSTNQLDVTTWEDSEITLRHQVSCPDSVVPEAVNLMIDGQTFAMSLEANNPQSNADGFWYAVTLMVNDESNDASAHLTEEGTYDMDIQVICPTQTLQEQTGVLTVLFDPSGQITDAQSGQPIPNAIVTLYEVPGWRPQTGPDDNDVDTCETVLSRQDGRWQQTAPTELGVPVNPAVDRTNGTLRYLPAVRTQRADTDGRFGWRVAEGCWYVTVQAESYDSVVSPIVGVPPLVIDLDMSLVRNVYYLFLPVIDR
ncbi:MAG: carboxypeptidase regulatory-like domain-containing protein [Chloroflexota bacterium]